jgi:hypothetical protein
MQKKFAGINPVCAVLSPIRQMITLFAPATIQPCHNRRPIRTVDTMVRTHEM